MDNVANITDITQLKAMKSDLYDNLMVYQSEVSKITSKLKEINERISQLGVQTPADTGGHGHMESVSLDVTPPDSTE